MRDQFNALKALFDAQQTQIADLQSQLNQKASMADVNAAIAANGANNVDGFIFNGDDISDPPQKVEVEDLQSAFGDLVQALKH